MKVIKSDKKKNEIPPITLNFNEGLGTILGELRAAKAVKPHKAAKNSAVMFSLLIVSLPHSFDSKTPIATTAAPNKMAIAKERSKPVIFKLQKQKQH